MKPLPKMHDPERDIARSKSENNEAFWDAVYRQAFPWIVTHCFNEDLRTQKLGVDRRLFFPVDHVEHADEKLREEARTDILLEFISNSATRAPGWIEKDLDTHWIVYGFRPTRTVYFWPWLFLRRAWLSHRDEWKATHRIIVARNPGYETCSVAVPITVLQKAVMAAQVVTVPELLPQPLPQPLPPVGSMSLNEYVRLVQELRHELHTEHSRTLSEARKINP